MSFVKSSEKCRFSSLPKFMCEKKFILSSAGLKNIIEEEKKFTFIFDQKKVSMRNINAEFLSPIVSRIHHSDPTIDSIYFKYPQNGAFSPFEELFSDETIKLITQISDGEEVTISSEQANKMQQVSILLCNDELFKSMQALYPQSGDESVIESNFRKLELFQCISNLPAITEEIDKGEIINAISSHFYSIDQEKLKKLGKPILFEIISNENLKIESEDSLFDFINELFNDDNYESNYTNIDFYEKLMFGNLSEDKFKEFSLKISGCEMTSPLWSSIRQRFIGKESVKDRYKSKNQTKPKKDLKSFPYECDSFNGIIRALTRECGGNVEDKGVVLVTSTEGYGGPPKCAADLDDLNSIRYTNNEKNGFIQYDFKEKKVRPTFYSIRSRNAGKNDYHLQSWVIEGSNSGMTGKFLTRKIMLSASIARMLLAHSK